jgi:hypothetical protein
MLTHILKQTSSAIRDDLDRQPEDTDCFYCNPLGTLAEPLDYCTNWSSRFLRLFLWDILAAAGKNGTNFELLNYFETACRDTYALLALWEYQYSIKTGHNNRLFMLSDMSEDTPSHNIPRTRRFTRSLERAYVLVAERALISRGLDKSNIPKKCFPTVLFGWEKEDVGKHKKRQRAIVKYASTAAADFKKFYDDYIETRPSVQLVNVPPDVLRLLLVKLRRKKAEIDRGNQIEKTIANAAKSRKRLKTYHGTNLSDWPAGIKRIVDKTGRSPTGDLIVAIAIHNWLDLEYPDPPQIGEKLKMNQVNLVADVRPLETALDLAGEIKLDQRFKNMRRFATNREEAFELLHRGAQVVIPSGLRTPIIRATLNCPDWLEEDPCDVATVIQTTARVDGKEQTETVYGYVEDAVDADDEGSVIRIEVVSMRAETPLLNMFALGSCDVQGVLVKQRLWGQDRAVLGIAVNLGEIDVESKINAM